MVCRMLGETPLGGKGISAAPAEVLRPGGQPRHRLGVELVDVRDERRLVLLGAPAEALASLLDDLERQRYGRAAAPRPSPQLTRRFKQQARRLHPATPG